jgi:hypothetical protein
VATRKFICFCLVMSALTVGGLPTVVVGWQSTEADSVAQGREHPHGVDSELSEEDAVFSGRIGSVLEAIAESWGQEDYPALSDLVAAGGVLIALSPQPERLNHYSANQAFYFFKNLFQSTSTDSFRFGRWGEETGGGTVHAVADWWFRHRGGESALSQRLFFTVTMDSSGWGLAEIRAIR